MSHTERPPIDLSSPKGIEETYDYFRELESDPEQSLLIHGHFAKAFHPRQFWAAGTEDTLAEHRTNNGRILWLPYHLSNVDPLVEAAASYRDPALRDMIGRVSIFTKTDWYEKPGIGEAIRTLYDTIPAIPISRHEDPKLRAQANKAAVNTMLHRMIAKGEDGVLYPTRHRIKENRRKVPQADHLGLGPEQIAAVFRAAGIPLMLLVTGRWLGNSALSRNTSGLIRPTLYHSIMDVPADLEQTRPALQKTMQRNVERAFDYS